MPEKVPVLLREAARLEEQGQPTVAQAFQGTPFHCPRCGAATCVMPGDELDVWLMRRSSPQLTHSCGWSRKFERSEFDEPVPTPRTTEATNA